MKFTVPYAEFSGAGITERQLPQIHRPTSTAFARGTLIIEGLDTGGVVSVDTLGQFCTTLSLIDVVNRIQAAAGNRAEVGS